MIEILILRLKLVSLKYIGTVNCSYLSVNTGITWTHKSPYATEFDFIRINSIPLLMLIQFVFAYFYSL